MCARVESQSALMSKSFPTQLTGKRLLTGVRPHMDGENTPLSETFPTPLT